MKIIIAYKNLKIAIKLYSVQDYPARYAYATPIAEIEYLEPLKIDDKVNPWLDPNILLPWLQSNRIDPQLFTEHLICDAFVNHLLNLLQSHLDKPDYDSFYPSKQGETYVIYSRAQAELCQNNQPPWVTPAYAQQCSLQFLIALHELIKNNSHCWVIQSYLGQREPIQGHPEENPIKDNSNQFNEKTITTLAELEEIIQQSYQDVMKCTDSLNVMYQVYQDDLVQSTSSDEDLKQSLLAIAEPFKDRMEYQAALTSFIKEVEMLFEQGTCGSELWEEIALALSSAYDSAHTLEHSSCVSGFNFRYQVKLSDVLREKFCEIFVKNLPFEPQGSTPADICDEVARYYKQQVDKLYQKHYQFKDVKASAASYCHHELNHQLYALEYLANLWRKRAIDIEVEQVDTVVKKSDAQPQSVVLKKKFFIEAQDIYDYLDKIARDDPEVAANEHIRSLRAYLGFEEGQEIIFMGRLSGRADRKLDLSIGRFQGVRFKFVTFTDCKIGNFDYTSFAGCTFRRCQLTKELVDVDFTGASFIDVTLEQAKSFLHSKLNDNWVFYSDFPQAQLHMLGSEFNRLRSNERLAQYSKPRLRFPSATIASIQEIERGEPDQKSLEIAGQYGEQVIQQQTFYEMAETCTDKLRYDPLAGLEDLQNLASLITEQMSLAEREVLIGSIVDLMIDVEQLGPTCKSIIEVRRRLVKPGYVDLKDSELLDTRISEAFQAIRGSLSMNGQRIIDLCLKIKPGDPKDYGKIHQNYLDIIKLLDEVKSNPRQYQISLILILYEHIRRWLAQEQLDYLEYRNDVNKKLDEVEEVLEKVNPDYWDLIYAHIKTKANRMGECESACNLLLGRISNPSLKEKSHLHVALYLLNQVFKSWLQHGYKNGSTDDTIEESSEELVVNIDRYFKDYAPGFYLSLGDIYFKHNPAQAANYYNRGLIKLNQLMSRADLQLAHVNHLRQSLEMRLREATLLVQKHISDLKAYLQEGKGYSNFEEIKQTFAKQGMLDVFNEVILEYQSEQSMELKLFLKAQLQNKIIDFEADQLSVYREAFNKVEGQASYQEIIISHNEQVKRNQQENLIQLIDVFALNLSDKTQYPIHLKNSLLSFLPIKALHLSRKKIFEQRLNSLKDALDDKPLNDSVHRFFELCKDFHQYLVHRESVRYLNAFNQFFQDNSHFERLESAYQYLSSQNNSEKFDCQLIKEFLQKIQPNVSNNDEPHLEVNIKSESLPNSFSAANEQQSGGDEESTRRPAKGFRV